MFIFFLFFRFGLQAHRPTSSSLFYIRLPFWDFGLLFRWDVSTMLLSAPLVHHLAHITTSTFLSFRDSIFSYWDVLCFLTCSPFLSLLLPI
jgi:hypothetical protein